MVFILGVAHDKEVRKKQFSLVVNKRIVKSNAQLDMLDKNVLLKVLYEDITRRSPLPAMEQSTVSIFLSAILTPIPRYTCSIFLLSQLLSYYSIRRCELTTYIAPYYSFSS
jgi:hypothetical protein